MVYRQGFVSVCMAPIGMLTPWRAEALQSVRKCWNMLHTKGNQCHLVTWIKIIAPWWSCTQCSMNMHLRQSPWAHTHTTRSRAFMTREGRSCSHESPSYKVHNHPPPPHTHTHIHTHTHTHTHIYTCIMHNAIT